MTCRLRSRAPHSDGPEEKSWAIVIDHQTKCGRLFSLFGILEVPSRSFACMRSRRVFSPTARSSRGAERTGRRFRLAAWRGKCRAGSSTKPRQSEGHSSETWKHRFASECVVVDAARIEPVSTSNSLLAGNLAGNFLKKGPQRTILVSKTCAASTAYNRIPCSKEQGIFLT
jgi:hypothetical protein